jgi:hypothetical protein
LDALIRPDFEILREGLDLIRRVGFRDATIVVDDGLITLAVLTGHPGVRRQQAPEAFGDDPQFDHIAKKAIEQFLALGRAVSGTAVGAVSHGRNLQPATHAAVRPIGF